MSNPVLRAAPRPLPFLVVSVGWLALSLLGCSSPEATQANAVAADRLRCDPSDMAAGIERETPVVREWIVGCDFTYTRVHCTDQGCTQAPPVPPCVDGDMPCMVEDPVTLKWVMLEDLHERRAP